MFYTSTVLLLHYADALHDHSILFTWHSFVKVATDLECVCFCVCVCAWHTVELNIKCIKEHDEMIQNETHSMHSNQFNSMKFY